MGKLKGYTPGTRPTRKAVPKRERGDTKALKATSETAPTRAKPKRGPK